MKFQRVNIEHDWIEAYSGKLEFVLYSRMLDSDTEFEWRKLDNNVEVFGIHVLEEYDNIIADEHPEFNNVFRFATEQ